MQKELEKLIDPTKKSAKMFSDSSFPTKKTESWIYTNPTLLFSNITEVARENSNYIGMQSEFKYKVVFINGVYRSESSNLPDGVTVHKKDLVYILSPQKLFYAL